MASIDLIFGASQSNALQSPERTGPANVMVQPNVPFWSAVILNPGDGRLKVAPRFTEGVQTNKQTFPFSASREWCAGPEFWAYRLATHYGHSVRLIKCGVIGASSYDSDWPNYADALMAHYLQQALTAADYPGTPDHREIVTIHGESDVASFSATYEAKIPGRISAIRAKAGAGVHWTCMQLSSLCTIAGFSEAKINAIRGAQQNAVTADGNASIIDLTPYELGPDGVHFSQAGHQAWGYAGADATHARITA